MNINIPIAVYTAREGYAWQTAGGRSIAELSEFLARIGKLPNVDMDAIPFGGAFSAGKTVVAYRLHKALHYDSRSRNALYVVLAFVPAGEAGRLDFGELFCSDEMSKPVYPPPSSVEMAEAEVPGLPRCDWFDIGRTSEYERKGLPKLGEIGPCFSMAAEASGELSLRVCGDALSPQLRYEFKAPARISPVPESLREPLHPGESAAWGNPVPRDGTAPWEPWKEKTSGETVSTGIGKSNDIPAGDTRVSTMHGDRMGARHARGETGRVDIPTWKLFAIALSVFIVPAFLIVSVSKGSGGGISAGRDQALVMVYKDGVAFKFGYKSGSRFVFDGGVTKEQWMAIVNDRPYPVQGKKGRLVLDSGEREVFVERFGKYLEKLGLRWKIDGIDAGSPEGDGKATFTFEIEVR